MTVAGWQPPGLLKLIFSFGHSSEENSTATNLRGVATFKQRWADEPDELSEGDCAGMR